VGRLRCARDDGVVGRYTRFMSSLLTGVTLFCAFQLLGAGLAIRLAAWADLPPRFFAVLTSVSTAGLSYGLFWLSYLAPELRSTAVGACAAVSLGSLSLALRHPQSRALLFSRESLLPFALTGGLCVAWLPPLLSGPPINHRIGWELPSDNILPGLVAYNVLTSQGVAPKPLLGDGGDRASERPPLQAAVVVAVGTLVRGSNDEYQILATLCQAQWAPALLLLALTARLNHRGVGFVLVACSFSGLFFINTVYTWPKLFSASLALGALAIAMEAPPARRQFSDVRHGLIAAACSLSLLAHPGPVFSLLALPLCWSTLRPIVRLQTTWMGGALALAVTVAAVAPWAAYQARVDPPTSRLLREHLADGRTGGSVTGVLLAANLERPLLEHARVRLGNVAMQLGNPLIDVWPGSALGARHEQFFRYGSALGVLLVGLCAAFRRGGAGTAEDAVRRLAVFAVVSLWVWSLMVFSAGNAVIHHSSPVTAALLFFAAGFGLTRLPYPIGATLLGIHAAASMYIWVWPVLSGR